MWDLSGTVIKPVSPALAGKFFTTQPPGKPCRLLLKSNFLYPSLDDVRVSQVAQLVKNPPAMQETPVQFLGQEDPLEKG